MPLEGTVLIADEQPLCREGMAALLSRLRSGLAIVQADRFAAVIGALSADEAITLIVVDLTLPGLNDVAGIRRLRARYPAIRIAVTASSLNRDSIVECLRAGVHGCIAKASPSAELMEALKVIGNGRIYVPANVSDVSPDEHPVHTSQLLSQRQREVLDVLASGKSNKEIARQLGIAEGTVKVHVNAVFRTLGVHNRVGAAAALRKLEENPDASEPALPGLLHPLRRVGDRQHIGGGH